MSEKKRCKKCFVQLPEECQDNYCGECIERKERKDDFMDIASLADDFKDDLSGDQKSVIDFDEVKKKRELHQKREKAKEIRKQIDLYKDEEGWNPVERLLIEIEAEYYFLEDIGKGEGLNTLPKRIEYLKLVIADEYEDSPEKRNLFLKGVPSIDTIRGWTKTKKWKKAVDTELQKKLLSPKNRAAAYSALMRNLKLGKEQSLKMFLTITGDLDAAAKAKEEEINKANKILHKQKKVNDS